MVHIGERQDVVLLVGRDHERIPLGAPLHHQPFNGQGFAPVVLIVQHLAIGLDLAHRQGRVCRLKPFLDATVTSFSQNNCDFDYSSGAILLRTPEQELSILNNISGDAVCLSSSIIPSNGETNSSWAVDFTQLVFTESGNDVTFWATNQSNSALPIFSSPTVFAAP